MVATVACIFALITLGGAVRLTESGLGCPDWPLCHGSILPPLTTPTLIEYSHRMMASFTGVLVLIATLWVWRSHRKDAWIMVPATLGFLLLIVQVLLGGVTVLSELDAEMVLAHLATAEGLVVSMVVVLMVALGHRPQDGAWSAFRGTGGRLPLLSTAALVGTFGLLLSGSYVTVSGASASCGQSWPICNGQLVPEETYPIIHMAHRVVALLVGALVLGVLVSAWRHRTDGRGLGLVAPAVAGSFVAQVLVGALVLWTAFPLGTRLAHLAVATLVMAGMAVLVIQLLNPPKPQPRGSESA